MGSLLRHFKRVWSHHTGMQVATLAVLSGTFAVISITFLVHQNLDQLLTSWGDNLRLSAYLEEGASPEHIANIKAAIGSFSEVENIKFISKDEAASRFQSQMASYAPKLIFDSEFSNPLPSSFEMSMKSGLDKSENYSVLLALASKVSKIAGVEDVSYGQGWVENYASLVKAFSVSSWVLILVLLAGSLFVVGNSIRSSISQRRDEIEILELIGATRMAIRLPFIYEGALMGLAASAISLFAIYLLFQWQASLLGARLGFWSIGSSLAYLSIGRVSLVLLLGAGFGALGSFLCVGQLSNGWTASKQAES